MTVAQYVHVSLIQLKKLNILTVFYFIDAKSVVFSLQRVLGLKTLDGILSPVHVNGKHIVHNIFSVNKAGVVVLENKAGMSE